MTTGTTTRVVILSITTDSDGHRHINLGRTRDGNWAPPVMYTPRDVLTGPGRDAVAAEANAQMLGDDHIDVWAPQPDGTVVMLRTGHRDHRSPTWTGTGRMPCDTWQQLVEHLHRLGGAVHPRWTQLIEDVVETERTIRS